LRIWVSARALSPRRRWWRHFHFDPRNFDHNVIIKLRLLRLCAAMVTGAALGVAGVLLQSVIRNPLGEPHILGLNAGAALAVVMTSALGLSLPFGRPLDCRRRCRRAVSAGADVLLVRSHRAYADEGHAVRRGDVGVCLVDYRRGVNSG
jgi:ABC-type Fe3+-siderophore transport system permease subunit